MANNNEKETFDAAVKSEAFFEKNKKVISGAIIAIIIVVAGVLCYNQFIGGPREQKASTALARGQEYFNADQFDKALNGDGAGYAGFVKIADDYSSTDAGNLANLYAGLCYANLNKSLISMPVCAMPTSTNGRMPSSILRTIRLKATLWSAQPPSRLLETLTLMSDRSTRLSAH